MIRLSISAHFFEKVRWSKIKVVSSYIFSLIVLSGAFLPDIDLCTVPTQKSTLFVYQNLERSSVQLNFTGETENSKGEPTGLPLQRHFYCHIGHTCSGEISQPVFLVVPEILQVENEKVFSILQLFNRFNPF